ncbi:hypothetical protein CC77DRAFT_1099632 [Alternaria alternata]|uniref:Uncharacterized protein n=1 Tax=Alternaria alternata TaxID=5599 RepID=A0A177D686_ALTAL|nr:hypothetical protein CC77DRAFT_1099632 [Alternaria alternata]OAG14841.1 hypothetical protein CC77DRAFT_1099632 [Alternaria alternata]RYN56891.1 hypothetical protein AA0118_g8048 [Alternaria tenuissima]
MAPSRTPRVALLGCGPWGRNLARSFAQWGALDTIVDAVPEQAIQLAEYIANQGFHQPTISSWEEVLKNTHIDAIALATPAPKHADMAVTCLAAGKHVFIEKPFALSVEDGNRVIQKAAETGNKIVMIGHLFQYHPAFIKLKDMVRKGRLGVIQHIHSRRLNFGRVREEENAFWNLGVHDLSMILTLANQSPDIVTVQGFHHLRQNIADVASVALSWSSGLQAHIHVSWLYPQKERKMIVVGDIATAVFDDCEPWETKLRVFNNSFQHIDGVLQAMKGGCEAILLQVQEPLDAECREFLDCVESGRRPITSTLEALPVVEVLGRIEAEIQKNRFDSHPVVNEAVEIDYQMPSDQRHDSITETTEQGEVDNLPAEDQVDEKVNRIGQHCESSIPLLDLATQREKLQDKLDDRIARVFQHGKFVLGPEVQELESKLSDFTGAAHVVTCGSGTGALTLSLLALGIQPGDAVLVPDLSFVATVEPVVLLGGIPVFVDVEPQHLTINATLIDAGVMAAKKAGHRAVGIIAVDLYGHPADYDALNEAASRHNLWIIGDAAQSFGGSLNGRRVGTLTQVTTTSFFPSKPLGCYGDGGAVFTEDRDFAHILKSLRQHGLDETKSNGLRIGLNSRLDTIQAAILLCKLDLLSEERKNKEKVASRYSSLLQSVVEVPTTRPGTHSAWAAYTIRSKHRDTVKQHLRDHGIAYAIYYSIPFHKQDVYQRFPVIEGSCPVTERACEEIISLPVGPYLSSTTQTRIVETIRKALG